MNLSSLSCEERARFHLEIENEQNRLKFEIVEQLHQTFPGLEKLFSSHILSLHLTSQNDLLIQIW